MVSHYDCAKHHNLRQFKLLKVNNALKHLQTLNTQVLKPELMVGPKLNALTLLSVSLMLKKERKIRFQGSVKNRRLNRTVWNHNTLPLHVTLDPSEAKNNIRHLNGTTNKILKNLHYNKTCMYTGTFTFMPAYKNCIYDPTRNPYHNCPAHHQFEVNLVSWRLEISEVELTYDDTANGMIIYGHTLPCHFADGFCKPTTKTPLHVFGSVMTFA